MDEPLFNELLESVKQADQIMSDHAELRRLDDSEVEQHWSAHTNAGARAVASPSTA